MIICNCLLICNCHVALPCPQLLPPAHGSMECTDNSQVVGVNCTFSCDNGYELVGSEMQTCQSNVTWSGVQTQCSILKCHDLIPLPNSQFLQSCSNELNTTCLLGCLDGFYTENGVIFEQTCQTIFDNSLNWTQPLLCKGIEYHFIM